MGCTLTTVYRATDSLHAHSHMATPGIVNYDGGAILSWTNELEARGSRCLEPAPGTRAASTDPRSQRTPAPFAPCRAMSLLRLLAFRRDSRGRWSRRWAASPWAKGPPRPL